MPTPAEILDRLRQIRYPGFSRDIVSFGVVQDIEVASDGVTVILAPSTAKEDVIREIEREVVAAVSSMPGIGGPVRLPKYDGRNRTFIFGSWESIRQKDPEAILATVPTALERTGDFSQSFDASGRLLPVYNPLSTRPNPASPGRFLRDPFPGNRIPANRIDPIALTS